MEGTQLTIEEIIDINPEAMMADGFYDYEKCIQILMKRDDMNKADALDFMEFNVIGAYVGLNTPVFIMR